MGGILSLLMFEMLLISAGIFSFILSIILIPVLIRLSIKFHWYDDINDRKIHTGKISRLAGVAVFYSSLIAVIIGIFLLNSRYRILEGVGVTRLITFLIAYALVHNIGLVDDFIAIKPRYKFIVQVIAALLIIIPDRSLSLLHVPFFNVTLDIGIFGYALAFFWIIGACNAVNLIDGMDGLSGGISAIAALFLAVIALAMGNELTAVIAFTLFGALTGFLVYNFPPAKIFIGDSGALFLGFALATLPFLEINYHSDVTLIIAVSILFVPVMDTLTAMLRRLSRRQSPFYPDREHIHHKLLDRKFTTRQILFTLYSVGTVLGGTVFLWSLTLNSIFLDITFILWIVLIVISIILEKHHADKKAE